LFLALVPMLVLLLVLYQMGESSLLPASFREVLTRILAELHQEKTSVSTHIFVLNSPPLAHATPAKHCKHTYTWDFLVRGEVYTAQYSDPRPAGKNSYRLMVDT
jgi:hypothetical protein